MGAHAHHPLYSRIDKKHEAAGRCQAGVLSEADFVGSPGLRSRRSYPCDSPGLTIPAVRSAPFLPREGECLCSAPRRNPPLCPARGAFILATTLAPVYRSFLQRPRYAHPAGCTDRPLDVAALPEPSCLLGQLQLQPAERALRARGLSPLAFASGHSGEPRASGKLLLVVPGRCTGWKKKQNQHPANETRPPPHSALLCSPPEGRLGRPPWAPSRISDRGPRSGQSWRGTAEEFASNTPDSLAFSLKPFRRAQGQLSADPSAPWERSGDAWLLAVSSLWSPGSSTGRIGLRAGCHLVKATGKGCFMGREKGQEVLLPSLATPGQSLNGGSPIWVWDAGRNKVGSETVGSSVRPLSV